MRNTGFRTDDLVSLRDVIAARVPCLLPSKMLSACATNCVVPSVPYPTSSHLISSRIHVQISSNLESTCKSHQISTPIQHSTATNKQPRSRRFYHDRHNKSSRGFPFPKKRKKKRKKSSNTPLSHIHSHSQDLILPTSTDTPLVGFPRSSTYTTYHLLSS